MKYVLILISLTHGGTFESSEVKTFDRMDECFKAREDTVKMLGRPIHNYQAVCVIKTINIGE